MNQKLLPLCKLHPDFHVPGEITGVGKEFDGLAYTAKLKSHSVDTIVVFAKCHYGFSYYPTEIGTVHPGLEKDLVKEIAKGANVSGLECVVYYSVFLDTEVVKKHPTWRLQPERSATIKPGSIKYEPVCVNSPYLEELMIPQTREILEQYPVEQMFFDTMSEFIPCYCHYCAQKFGGDIPGSKDAGWLDYVQWYHKCYRDFYARTAEAVYEINPRATCVFNWEWSINHPTEPVPYIQLLAGDLFPSGKVSSFFSRYWSGTGLPFDYMNGRFMHGLGDWCSNNDLTLQYTAASTLANGGGVYLIDRQLPNGLLEERSYDTMDAVFSFVNNRRDWVTNCTVVPEVAVLTTCDHLVGSKLELFPDKDARKKRLEPIKAIGEILIDGGVHFTYLSEANLLKNINSYALVLLPELFDVSKELTLALAQYAENGGKVLIIQCNEDKPNPHLMQLAGVTPVGKTLQNYTYIEFSRNKKTDMPFVVRGANNTVMPCEGTIVLSKYIEPQESIGGTFGHGFAPPTCSSKYAAATLRQVGSGQILYLSPCLLSSYREYYNPDIAQYILQMVDTLLPTPLVRLKTDAPIEKSIMRQDNDLIIHLVNHAGPEILAGGWCPITKYIPTITDICLTVQPSRNEATVKAFSSKPTELDGSGYKVQIKNDGEIHISGIALHIMESIRIRNYF